MEGQDRKTYEAAVAYAKANKKTRCAELTDTKIYLPEDQPVSVFMAGSPGAGKTEAAKELVAQFEAPPDGVRVLRIDPDELRAEFPGYTGSNSWLFQGASSIWVDRMLDLALSQRQSFILDSTFSNLNRARRNVERSLKQDRVVVILYVYQSPLLAWQFVQARELAEGRRIPLDTFINHYFAARDVVNTLKREFGADIAVDLLLKPNDEPVKLVRIGIEQIDYHVPERFSREELAAALRIQS